MKFLIDMPLSPGLASWLVEHGYNAVHALEVGLDRASDTVILERARREKRVIIRRRHEETWGRFSCLHLCLCKPT